MFNDELKAVPIADLQVEISKAIHKLTGIKYHCSINELKYELSGANFAISLREHNSFLGSEPPPFEEAISETSEN